MKRYAAAALLLLALGAPVNAQAASLRPVDQDGLNVRSGPGTTHQILGTLGQSQSAAVLGQEGDWYRVRTPGGVEGWVSGEFSRVSYEDEQVHAVVNTDILNLRGGASAISPVLERLYEGHSVRLLEVTGEWWRVRLSSGMQGWVAGRYMRLATAPAQPAEPAQPPAPAGPPPAPAPTTPPPPPVALPPATPPPAPPGTVPVLGPQQQGSVPTGAPKSVHIGRETGVYFGRSTTAFQRVDTAWAAENALFLSSAEGWLQVETARGHRGWIPGSTAIVLDEQIIYTASDSRWSLGFRAQGAAPAPALPVPAPQPVPVRRAVMDPDGLRLRQSPALDGAILAVLPLGAEMEVLESQGPWLRVRIAGGWTGWVYGEFTALLTAPAGQPPAAPGVSGSLQFADGFRATLVAPAPGVLRLEVESAAHPLGQPRQEGGALLVPVATGLDKVAILPVVSAGVQVLALNPAGVGLTFTQAPAWQVLEASPGKVVIEMRPVLQSVLLRKEAGRQVYSLNAVGHLSPKLRAEGDALLLDLPGVKAMPQQLPEGVRAEITEGGLKLSFASRQAYTLKRIAGGFELHLYTPGLAGKRILLDPGHGGLDGGAWNRFLGIREKELNLDVALRLRAALEAQGATVLMTRASDVQAAPANVLATGSSADRHQIDLGYRTRMANELNVDLFLSIHHNAGTGSGTETYYTASTLNGAASGSLAGLLQEELLAALGTVNRGVKNDLMFVTRNTDAPAALMELGFISHDTEARRLATPEFQVQAVEAMVRALKRFYSERP